MPKLMSSRQTKLKLRKGFTAAPISYRVLMISQFTDKDKKIIERGLVKALTPEKAKELLPKPNNHLLPQSERSQWRMMPVSMNGNYDINVLTYKGLDIAVFHKRQTSVVTPEPEDPQPEGYIENDDDIWARLDLFSKSPRQLVGSASQDLTMKEAQLQQYAIEVETQSSIIEKQSATITSLRKQLKEAQTSKLGKRKQKEKA